MFSEGVERDQWNEMSYANQLNTAKILVGI